MNTAQSTHSPGIPSGEMAEPNRKSPSTYDPAMKPWEKELLGPGDWCGSTLGLLRGSDGEIHLPSAEMADSHVQGLNEVERYLLHTQAQRIRKAAFWWRLPFWLTLGWMLLWLFVAYPLVHYCRI